MEKQYFYSSDNFMPNQMGTCKPLNNKYTDCTYPMQPMMPQPGYQKPVCMPQVDLYKSFNFPNMQPMYAPYMTNLQQPMFAPQMVNYQMQQPINRKGEEKKPQQLIPVQPIKLPEIKPMPMPVPIQIPMPEVKPAPIKLPEIKPIPVAVKQPPMEITIKKTQATFIPQQMPPCPVMTCMPCTMCGECHMPFEPCMLPMMPYIPCPPQPFGFGLEDHFCDFGCPPFHHGAHMGMFPYQEE